MKARVVYEDGTAESCKVKPRHLLAFEDEYGEFTESSRTTFRLVHIASQRPEDFEDWIETVDDIEVDSADDAAVPRDATPEGEPVPTG